MSEKTQQIIRLSEEERKLLRQYGGGVIQRGVEYALSLIALSLYPKKYTDMNDDLDSAYDLKTRQSAKLDKEIGQKERYLNAIEETLEGIAFEVTGSTQDPTDFINGIIEENRELKHALFDPSNKGQPILALDQLKAIKKRKKQYDEALSIRYLLLKAKIDERVIKYGIQNPNKPNLVREYDPSEGFTEADQKALKEFERGYTDQRTEALGYDDLDWGKIKKDEDNL